MDEPLQSNPINFYRETIEKLSEEHRRLKKILLRFSLSRLTVFIFTLILIYLSVNWGWVAMVLIIITGIGTFLVLVKQYQLLAFKIRHVENLESINKKELKALEGDYLSFGSGKEYADAEHPYSNDLDLFGTGSLFQFLNRTSTRPGKKKLAELLTSLILDRRQIRLRQEAIRELSEKVSWRQEFGATGYEMEESEADPREILRWAKEKPELSHPMVTFWLFFIPVLAGSVIVLSSLGILPSVTLLFFLIISLTVYSRYKKIIDHKHSLLSKRSAIIDKYGKLLKLIEEVEFSSEELMKTYNSLGSEGKMPSERLGKLHRILNAFDTRLNLLAGFFLNILFLWDIWQSKRLENWLSENSTFLSSWIDTIAFIDSLNCLANYHFNNPGTIFPEIVDNGPCIEGKDLGHPLIPVSQLVKNPVLISDSGQFHIVTGANMAGKSTYLRTVGITLILAMAGAPVIASVFRFSPVSLISSIRASDSLTKNESYFYAELKHLKRIVDRLEAGERLFILLDEILKGTNSKDKQSGSVAFVRKLLKFDGSGLIATHDLALGDLERDFPDHISNKSFEVVIKDDQLVFDYLLKDGVARQMNATFLMHKMGIT